MTRGETCRKVSILRAECVSLYLQSHHLNKAIGPFSSRALLLVHGVSNGDGMPSVSQCFR